MIALLRGRVVAAGLGEVVLDVGGVGYRVHVAPGTVATQSGASLTLHTHLAVREDALTLYGFADAGTRDLFVTLLGVSGVGPKLALAALGTLGGEGLRRAVVTEDVQALTVVPGVGRKGAQRIVLELRERLGRLDGDVSPAVPGDGQPGRAGPRGEVREALVTLGYAPAEIQQALDALPLDGNGSAEELLREALRNLGGKR